jgi:phosphohistidine phosphatase
MRLYLVRHAHALAEDENPARPLSPKGTVQAQRLAAFLSGPCAFRPDVLWHSPLVRSRETASALLPAAGPEATLVETPGLLPEDDPAETAARLEARGPGPDLAIVGHEPHLSALATLLLRGKPHPVGFSMKKGAVLALEPAGTHKKTGLTRWRVLWHLHPDLLP